MHHIVSMQQNVAESCLPAANSHALAGPAAMEAGNKGDVAVSQGAGQADRRIGEQDRAADPGSPGETVVALRRENAALKERLAVLSRSNSDLEQFAWSAGHDLKEPLRTIAGYAQLLLRRRPPAPGSEDADFAGYMLQGVERMRVMIDGLLEYARAGRDQEPSQAGDVPIEPNGEPNAEPDTELSAGPDMDTAAIAAETLDGMRNLLEQCGAMVSIAPLPGVAVARVPLLQIFSNLIGNGVKYRTEGVAPQIEVWAAAPSGGAMVTFAVRDHGIGIDPEFHSRIFGPFQRLHGDDYPGIGLGLALTRRLVERHGGRIWVESEAGAGSTFYFTLPSSAEEPGTPAAGCPGAHDAAAAASQG
jgi:light-regulated signal transduction histidine kinase (bacteriophytochrome)